MNQAILGTRNRAWSLLLLAVLAMSGVWLPTLSWAGTLEQSSGAADAPQGGPPIGRSFEFLGAWSPEADLSSSEGTAFSQQHYRAEYRTFIPLTKEWFFRGGGGWGAFFFDYTGSARYPDSLHRLNVDIGFGRRLGENFSVFASVSPGVYSDFEDVTWDDVMAFGILAVQWTATDSVEFYAGARINPVDKFPVLPLAGLKWDISDSWRIDAMYPRPSLVWQPSEVVEVFAGMEIRGSNYRTGENFEGRTPDGRQLNNEWLAYSEFSAVGGVAVQVSRAMKLEASAGYAFRRKFDYDEVDYSEETDEGAFLGQLALSVRF